MSRQEEVERRGERKGEREASKAGSNSRELGQRLVEEEVFWDVSRVLAM